LLFLLFPILIFSQNFDYKNSFENISNWIEINNEKAKLEYINKLKVTHSNECFFNFFNLNEFFIIDIDRDGLKDILITGDCMMDAGLTAIYRYNGTYFEELLKVNGKIHQVSDYDSNLPFSFTLNNYGCCGGFDNVLEKYILVLENGSYSYKLQSRENFVFETEFPETYFKKPIAFKTVKEKYNLRFSPEIDDTSAIARPYNAYGNTVWIYPSNSIGFAIAETKDKTGRIWWFVKMDNKTAKGLEYTSEVGTNSKEPTFSLGWISSNFVEKIE